MSNAALQNLTLSHYLKTVRGNFRTFLFDPSVFGARFINTSSAQISKKARRIIERPNKAVTNALYFPFLISFILVNFLIVFRSNRDQVASLTVKMFTVCIFLQPFVHPSHQRYWPSFAPMMSIAAGYAASWICQDAMQNRMESISFLKKDYPCAVLSSIPIVYAVLFCAVSTLIITA